MIQIYKASYDECFILSVTRRNSKRFIGEIKKIKNLLRLIFEKNDVFVNLIMIIFL